MPRTEEQMHEAEAKDGRREEKKLKVKDCGRACESGRCTSLCTVYTVVVSFVRLFKRVRKVWGGCVGDGWRLGNAKLSHKMIWTRRAQRTAGKRRNG